MLSDLDRALLFRYLRPEWTRAARVAVFMAAGIGLQLANPLIARTFIDQAQAGATFDRLIVTALVFLGVAAATQVADVAESVTANDLGWRTTNALRADLTRHVLELDGSFHAEHGAGDLIERIDGDVGAIARFFSRFLMNVIGGVAFLLGVLVMLVREDWRIGALMTAFAVVALLYMTRGGGFVGRRARDTRRAAAALSGYLEEHLGGLEDIKANGADGHVMGGLYERMRDRYHRIDSEVMAAVVFNAGIWNILTLGIGASLVMGALLFRADVITLGTVYVVFRYGSMLGYPLARLANELSAFQHAVGGLVRVRDLLATQPSVTDGAGHTLPQGALGVAFEDVSFAYEREPVLRDVSVTIAPGEVVGLLGRTGSGKTTISRLLFRLYDPTAGTIRLGGTDARQATLADLRSRVALVTQDVQLFDATLRDNVALFDDAVDDARIRAAFDELGLTRWLTALPDGLDTVLGHGARGLSAGEAQLVALTRVFLGNPSLVVLDEASSRLDPATEALLEDAMTRLLAGRTGVVIAHRLATVERADRVVILESGRIVEDGARDTLAADPGSRYALLLRAGMSEVLA